MSACDNGTCKCCPRCGCRATCTCNRNLGFEQGASDMSCSKATAGLETTGDDAGHNDSSSCATKVDGNNNEVVFFATGVAGETEKTCARAAPYKDIGNGNGFFSNEA